MVIDFSSNFIFNCFYFFVSFKNEVNFVPFDDYIQADKIEEYHRVVVMEKFMKEIAPIIWPGSK